MMLRLFTIAALCLTVSACALPVPLMALSGAAKFGAFVLEEEDPAPAAGAVTVPEMLARVRGEAPFPEISETAETAEAAGASDAR
ncbi:MAG: hypothetical protein ACYYKD_12800 [Rhodospirillales bacterium]